jgi:hypothetical protein
MAPACDIGIGCCIPAKRCATVGASCAVWAAACLPANSSAISSRRFNSAATRKGGALGEGCRIIC